MRGSTTPGGHSSQPSSNQCAYHILTEVTNSKKCQLKGLAQSLPDMLMVAAKKAIRGLTSSIENLCKRINLVEGVVTYLKSDMKDLKEKSPMENSDMATLAKVMNAPKNTQGPIDTLIKAWISRRRK